MYLRIWFISERKCRYVCFLYNVLIFNNIEWSEFTHQIIHVRHMNTINWKTTTTVCVWYAHSINSNFHWLRNGVYTRIYKPLHMVYKWDLRFITSNCIRVMCLTLFRPCFFMSHCLIQRHRWGEMLKKWKWIGRQ